MNKVITRIPPSPTGNLHLGTARTALFNFLYAKQNNGEVVLRFEDTDKERSTDEFAQNILQGLTWLGIVCDQKFKQSERTDVYKKYIDKMIDDGTAYISKESGGERSEVIRFKNPNKVVTFKDEIRGDITFDTTELGDFVIAKSDTEPLYHLAVVIDDFEMKITHIIRGEDGISNTPRQILIQEAIGAPRPIYVHLPLILGKDKTKLSKRHGAKAISDYKKEGYLPEAILNHLLLLGWNPGTDKELFTLEEMIKEFDLKHIQKGSAVFDPEKLDWFNKKYIQKIPKEEGLLLIKDHIGEFQIDPDILERAYPEILERISKIGDIDKMVEEGDLEYFGNEIDYEHKKLIWKDDSLENTKGHLLEVRKLIETIPSFSGPEVVKSLIWNYADEKGRGNVLWPLRYSLSGKDKSPDPFTLAYILGKEKTIERINNAIEKLTK